MCTTCPTPGISEASRSADGSALAIIRTVEGLDRLEYPIGKVLHSHVGYLSDLKISPQGDRIAFFEHPVKWDDRGSIRVVDLAGQVTTLAEGYWGAEGIAWARDGESILYSADRLGGNYGLRSVDLDGNERLVRSDNEGLVIHEVNANGLWFVSK